jgi:hypothetical protein
MHPCERQEQLRQAALVILRHMDELSLEQMDALNASDYDLLLLIDKKLEDSFGEKERAFGALLNHCREHGCATSVSILKEIPLSPGPDGRKP